MAQTGVVSWSQTASSNATADSTVNWAEGMAPSAVNDSARAEMASVAKYRDDTAGSLLTTGTATAYALTTNQVFSSLTTLNGQELKVRFHLANGTAPTLNVDALGAKPIYIDNANAVHSGSISANSVWHVTYDNSIPGFILNNVFYETPVGAVTAYAGAAAPSGWLACDGSAISRTTYVKLFNVLSTTFGAGDGSTTFNLPDLGGRVIAGKESVATRLTSGVSGVDGGTLGASGGNQNLHAHTHTDTGHTHSFVGATGITANRADSGAGTTDLSGQAATITIGTASANITSTGSGASQNVQPTIVLNYIIYAGV